MQFRKYSYKLHKLLSLYLTNFKNLKNVSVMENKNRWPREFYASDAEAEEIYDKDGQLPADLVDDDQGEALLAEPYYGDENDIYFSFAGEEDDAIDSEDDSEGGGDWGNVDPQSGGFPTGNEPTAPGSAV
jgi:hypothetical protein